ncbi:hypothetical protein M413DRAFT_11380 [Hebeloma cylindrosporum]|uniref:Uncharacterized protein n=1 Tax=Hebeloma cylindrosporum TaxID=76867 RepID=A0A0C3BUW1_HEBCY|nr:hypothetical protein M413DRAFT_11380 [Hebeloma cylindrosporum h7]
MQWYSERVKHSHYTLCHTVGTLYDSYIVPSVSYLLPIPMCSPQAMGSHYAPALSIEERRSTPTINLGGADGVYDGDRVPDILVEDYDTISSGAGDWSSLPQRPFLSAPYSQLKDNGWPNSPNSFRGSEETNSSSLPLATAHSQDNVWPDSSNPFRGSEEMKSSSLSPTTSNSQYYGWPSSSKSFSGSKDMYSSSSSPAASKLSPDTSFDFHRHFSSDQQSFNRGTERHSRSCPTSPTAVVSSGLSWLRIHASNEFIDNPSQPLPHTPSSSSSSASEMSTVSITDLLDNCAPIYQNSQPGTSSDSSSFYLSPPPFQRSPNSFRGSDEMNSSSSSLAAPSNISSDASLDFDGFSFSDQQPFNLEIWRTSQSCPASITTFPASSSQFNLSRPETFVPERPFIDNYQPSPSSAPQTATGSNTVLLDNCAPIYPIIRAGASAGFPSFDLSPSSFQPNWSFPPRRIA